ncbi:MAG TPA: hypothetical protein VFN73_12430, partial [Propionibacteriaceae bacterium]|nr:hypothetical protein [Propionibacteriaceae bacterium]
MVGVWVVRRALVFALFVRWFIMAYSIVAIREVEDQEGDWIYPTASLDGTSLIQIAEDEYPSSPITFRALSVHAFSPTRTVKLVDWQETGEMIITRDRVTVALEKF